METTISPDLSTARVVLQSHASSFEEKLNALRKLYIFVTSTNNTSSSFFLTTKKLILDFCLKFVLNEDLILDLRKRQLLRAEVFIMISNLMSSCSIFQNISDSVDGSYGLTETEPIRESKSASGLRISNKPDQYLSAESPILLSKTLSPKRSSRSRTKSNSLALSSSSGDLSKSLSLIEKKMLQKPRKVLKNKKLRPRPWLYTGTPINEDNEDDDDFVPGGDATNFIEQDKKLGYQKPRMWFPTMLSTDQSLLPKDRLEGTASDSSDRIVDEFLQMKALISYLGDIVLPKDMAKSDLMSDSAAKIGIQREILRSLLKKTTKKEGESKERVALIKRLEGLLDTRSYKESLNEAAQLWTPLLGINLPASIKSKLLVHAEHHKPRKDIDDSSCDNSSLYGTKTDYSTVSSTTISSQSIPKNPLRADFMETTRSIAITKTTLRKLFRRELVLKNDAKTSLRTSLDKIVSLRPHKFQEKLTSNLQEQHENAVEALEKMKTLMQETVKLQYSTLPSNYLLIVEGQKANSRKAISKLMFTFARVKRRNYLMLAFGIWKLFLVEAISLANRPKYARVASVYLMVEWYRNRNRKRMKLWIEKWKKIVTYMIFRQRYFAVIPIQAMYRYFRDRRIFYKLHAIKPFNGPLSDIYLAPYRTKIRYRISRTIRSQRRALWIAATVIQSYVRMLQDYKVYQHRRHQIVLIQSICRMIPKRKYFLRLRKWTIKSQAWSRRMLFRVRFVRLRRASIILQKYYRRHRAKCWRYRVLDRYWIALERRISAAWNIQQKFRAWRACRRIERIKKHRRDRQWAALTIQRLWYKVKGAFATFLLMSSYRAVDDESREFQQLIVSRGRRKFASKIVMGYRVHYFNRVLSSVVKVQCWYRGRRGYNSVDLLRKQRWASRKLRHFLRVRMKYRHALVRKIQAWWWSLKRGRRMRHLRMVAYRQDKAYDRIEDERRYHAATKIQAVIHGIWCRRYVVRYKAACIIQRPLRFYLARLKWKKEKREQSLSGIKIFVNEFLTRAVLSRTRYLSRLHSFMLRKPQAWIRGYLVRKVMKKAREFAYRFGVAVVTIQRFWRRSGAMAAAVQEILALKRLQDNPLKDSNRIHDIMMFTRKETLKYYHYRDPRVGLRVSTFLWRLSASDLLPMFPRKDYLYVSQLRGLTMEKLIALYDNWKNAPIKDGSKQRGGKAEKKSSSTGGATSNAAAKKIPPPPKDVFQKILDILQPPLLSSNLVELKVTKDIMTVQECMTPMEFFQWIQRVYARKFGKGLIARAQNLAKSVTESSWNPYSNYVSLWDCLTRAHVQKAVQTSPDSSLVRTTLEELRRQFPIVLSLKTNSGGIGDDRQWEIDRIKTLLDLLQLAMDKVLLILPPGVLLDLVDRTFAKVNAYKRRLSYLLARSKKKSLVSSDVDVDKDNASLSSSHAEGSKENVHGINPNNNGAEASSNESLSVVLNNPTLQLDKILSVDDCLDLPFQGALELVELDMNLSIVKMYLQVLDVIYTADHGIHVLKRRWKSRSSIRLIAKMRLKTFLETQTQEYIHERHDNHVLNVWKKFRRVEEAAQKLRDIMDSVAKVKLRIEYELSLVLRYGWTCYEEEESHALYYLDDTGREEPTYEAPRYTYDQYRKVSRIQEKYRNHLVYLREKQRLREIRIAEEMAQAEANWLKDQALFSRHTKITFQIRDVDMGKRYMKLSLSTAATGSSSNEEAPMMMMKRILSTESSSSTEDIRDIKLTMPINNISHSVNGTRMGDEDGEGDDNNTSGMTSSSSSSSSSPNRKAEHASNKSSNKMTNKPGMGKKKGSKEEGNQDMIDHENDLEQIILEPIGMKYKTSQRPEITDADIEELLPWRLQYEKNSLYFQGVWAFLLIDKSSKPNDSDNGPNSSSSSSSSSSAAAVELVAITRVMEGGKLFDVRSKRGHKLTNIPRARLVQMNLDRNCRVEARFKGQTAFYRGKIVNITKSDRSRRPVYSVQYDDGDQEDGLTRDMIRPQGHEISRFLVERAAMQKLLKQQKRRMDHFQHLNQLRSANRWQTIENCHREFLMLWKLLGTLPVKESNNSKKNKKGGRNDTPNSTSWIMGSNLLRMLEISRTVRSSYGYDLKLQLNYVRRPLRYGWVDQKDVNGKVVSYLHVKSKLVTSDRPAYNSKEDFFCRKIQSIWRRKVARDRVRDILNKESVDSLIRQALMKCRRPGTWIGFQLEGLTSMMILRRCGYFDIADAIEIFFQQKKEANKVMNIKMETLLDMKETKFEDIGILSLPLSKRFREFQTWWKRTAARERERGLMCFNWFESVEDTRSLTTCVRDSEELIVQRFLKVFPSSVTRTKSACSAIVDSRYPHTWAQIDNYLKKYSSKPELARECVYELIDKPTTSTWKEEEDMFKYLRRLARRLGVILGNLKLHSLRLNVSLAEEKADGILDSIAKIYSDGKRIECSGPEARACLVLRVNVFEYMSRVMKSVRLLQKYLRGLGKRLIHIKLVKLRRKSILLIQRVVRGFVGRCKADFLRRQMQSEWEQIYDEKRQVMYYYNNIQGESVYEEPKVPYRPLVRDRLSAKLMQSWPFLDEHRDRSNIPAPLALLTQSGEPNKALWSKLICQMCQSRRAVRICWDCIAPSSTNLSVSLPSGMAYCFSCFTSIHGDNPATQDHHGEDIEEPLLEDGLKCCQCQAPATRQCLGILTLAEIDSLCAELEKASVTHWMEILMRSKVGGEKKLMMFVQQLQEAHESVNGSGTSSNQGLVPSNLPQIRNMLERLRSECDECYCRSCYEDSHSGGKRKNHHWIGFQAHCVVCSVCSKSAAEVECQECQGVFCPSCAKVFHTMGKKRKHHRHPLLEPLEEGQHYCPICQRRPATDTCSNEGCEFIACDSCLVWSHQEKCNEKYSKRKEDKDRKELQSRTLPNRIVFPCVVCGEPADQRCLQCGDFYCSNTWMGNPGCFFQHHSKGKRQKHITEPFASQSILSQ